VSSRPPVILLNRFYWPDLAATGQMLTDLAEDLAAGGWDVRVITGRAGYASSAKRLPAFETRTGVHITRVSGTRFGRTTLLGRLLDYVTYVIGAAFVLLRVPRGSIIVGMTDPPLLATLAVLFARVHRGKSIYWVQDVFPDIAARLGTIKEGGIADRLCAAVARAIYRRSDLLVALGPAMARALVARGAPANRVRVIHNWADACAIEPIARDANPFIRAHGLDARFVLQYSGNAGRAHTFDAVCAAMELLRDESDILFQFIGGGGKTPGLKAMAARAGLNNVQFLDYLPRDELPFSLSAASVSLVTEDPRVIGLLLPSKTYGILASGRPLLFVGSAESDVAAIIRETGCGRVVDPGDSVTLAAAILGLRNDPAELAALGARARRSAETMYNRRASTAAWSEALELVAGGESVPAQPHHRQA
jgi:colanic acid biosynthesis glycosyl transferase WcaI